MVYISITEPSNDLVAGVRSENRFISIDLSSIYTTEKYGLARINFGKGKI